MGFIFSSFQASLPLLMHFYSNYAREHAVEKNSYCMYFPRCCRMKKPFEMIEWKYCREYGRTRHPQYSEILWRHYSTQFIYVPIKNRYCTSIWKIWNYPEASQRTWCHFCHFRRKRLAYKLSVTMKAALNPKIPFEICIQLFRFVRFYRRKHMQDFRSVSAIGSRHRIDFWCNYMLVIGMYVQLQLNCGCDIVM